MLRNQEILALELIFRGDDDLSIAIREKINEAESVDWEETGVGFYSKIRMNSLLGELPDVRMWEYNFSHPKFPHGGSFMCTIISESELELEAVAFGGANWPYLNSIEEFKELS